MLQQLKDIGERALTTFVITFISLFGLSGAITMTATTAAAVGGLAAALSLIKNALTGVIAASNGGTWWQDMLERTMWTFIQVWIGLIVVNGTIAFSQWKITAIAAIPAALDVIKSVLASRVGDPDTAAFLRNPAVSYTPQHGTSTI